MYSPRFVDSISFFFFLWNGTFFIKKCLLFAVNKSLVAKRAEGEFKKVKEETDEILAKWLRLRF